MRIALSISKLIRKLSKDSNFFKRFYFIQKIPLYTNKLVILKSEITKNVRDMGEKESSVQIYDKLILGQDRRTMETRGRIYDLISKNPGLHLSKIADILNMSEQLAEYHLIYMIKNNLIIDTKDEGGHYKRFYLKDGNIGIKDKKKLSILRQKKLLKIISILLKHHNLQHKELVSYLNIPPSTLSYQLNKLIESEIVIVTPYGEEKGYALKDENEIIWLIDKYNLEKSTITKE